MLRNLCSISEVNCLQPEHITSIRNPLLQHIRKLQSSRSYRESSREFVADGWKLFDEALKWDPLLKTVILAEGETCPEIPENVRLVQVPASLMQSLSTMKTPQGILFTCAFPRQETAKLQPGMLVLDRIQDPGNLGTILRTADAFDVPVVLTNGCADPFSEKTIRASMGAVFRTPPVSICLEELLKTEVPVAALALSETACDIEMVNLKNFLVVIGSEGQGICRELLNKAAQHVIIPMTPRCESLNAGIAAAIAMWQLRK